MFKEKCTKTSRILMIYSKLIKGELIEKNKIAEICNVSEKSIQRDIEDLRAYFYDYRNIEMGKEILFNRNKKGYYLENEDSNLRKQEILVLIKILLESRALCQDELNHLTKALLNQVGGIQRKEVESIINNEMEKYSPLKHGDPLLSKIWDLSELIRKKELTEILYRRADDLQVKRIIKPVAIMFSEYYFYLLAYFDDYDSPSIFRVDRISCYKSLNKKFRIPYSERFEDGEFRNRVQFMYPGKLIKTKFEFSGGTLEAIMDRLPTAKIVKEEACKTTIEAEVYGKGIIMWFLSQGSKIKVLSPESLVVEIKEEINELYNIYK